VKRLPKSPFDRVLTSAETTQLMKKGWEMRYVSPCSKCYGRGCEHCNDLGIVGTIVAPRSSEHYFCSPPLEPTMVGARCSIFASGGKLILTAMGAGGEARMAFYPTQLFELMKFLVIGVADGFQGHEACLEFGVEAQFTGPPVMYLAALSKKRMTCTHRPTAKQARAIKILKDAGFENEAGLLASALEHEVFRGNAKESEKCRKAVGKIEPGTVFKRVGNCCVMPEEKKK
jgi:hypothetical protein